MAKKTKVEMKSLGEFTIDPAGEEFKRLRSVCEPGNPWRCLIATVGSMNVGKRITVRLDHNKQAGTIGVTEGEYRYERPMTAEEVAFATKFDLGMQLRKPLTVRLDLSDGKWKKKAKGDRSAWNAAHPVRRPVRTSGKPGKRSIRSRQLAAIKQDHAAAS